MPAALGDDRLGFYVGLDLDRDSFKEAQNTMDDFVKNFADKSCKLDIVADAKKAWKVINELWDKLQQIRKWSIDVSANTTGVFQAGISQHEITALRQNTATQVMEKIGLTADSVVENAQMFANVSQDPRTQGSVSDRHAIAWTQLGISSDTIGDILGGKYTGIEVQRIVGEAYQNAIAAAKGDKSRENELSVLGSQSGLNEPLMRYLYMYGTAHPEISGMKQLVHYNGMVQPDDQTAALLWDSNAEAQMNQTKANIANKANSKLVQPAKERVMSLILGLLQMFDNSDADINAMVSDFGGANPSESLRAGSIKKYLSQDEHLFAGKKVNNTDTLLADHEAQEYLRSQAYAAEGTAETDLDWFNALMFSIAFKTGEGGTGALKPATVMHTLLLDKLKQEMKSNPELATALKGVDIGDVLLTSMHKAVMNGTPQDIEEQFAKISGVSQDVLDPHLFDEVYAKQGREQSRNLRLSVNKNTELRAALREYDEVIGIPFYLYLDMKQGKVDVNAGAATTGVESGNGAIVPSKVSSN